MIIEDKVRKLIELGYDDDVISCSLNISENELNFIKQIINQEKKSKPPTKLQQLRGNYYRIYNGVRLDNDKEDEIFLTDDQLEDVRKIIEILENEFQDFSNKSQNEQFKILNRCKKLIKPLEKMNLPLDFSERLYNAIPQNIKVKDTSLTVYGALNGKMFQNKIANSLEQLINVTNNEDELKELLKNANHYLSNSFTVLARIQNKISKKIEQLKSNKNSLLQPTEGIEKIVDIILSGDYKKREVKKLLDVEVQNYIEKRNELSRNNSKFSQQITIENARTQINYMIGNIIRENNEKKINANNTYKRLVDIYGKKELSLNIVIENLIFNSRFDDANKFIDKEIKNFENPEEKKFGYQLKRRIRVAQIADFIMKGINAPEGSIADENKYYETILSGIKKADILPSAIILGKTKDGLRNITFDEIMEKEKKKNQKRGERN